MCKESQVSAIADGYRWDALSTFMHGLELRVLCGGSWLHGVLTTAGHQPGSCEDLVCHSLPFLNIRSPKIALQGHFVVTRFGSCDLEASSYYGL